MCGGVITVLVRAHNSRLLECRRCDVKQNEQCFLPLLAASRAVSFVGQFRKRDIIQLEAARAGIRHVARPEQVMPGRSDVGRARLALANFLRVRCTPIDCTTRTLSASPMASRASVVPDVWK